MENLETLVKAMREGKAAALATTIGQPFRGAIPEAESAGYERGTVGHDVFVAFFLGALKPYNIEMEPTGQLVTGFYLKTEGAHHAEEN